MRDKPTQGQIDALVDAARLARNVFYEIGGATPEARAKSDCSFTLNVMNTALYPFEDEDLVAQGKVSLKDYQFAAVRTRDLDALVNAAANMVRYNVARRTENEDEC